MRFLSGRSINRLALPITRNCNRDCPECTAKSRKPGQTHVSCEELERVGGLVGKIGFIELTGGEPTLHPEFVRISESIHDWFDCRQIMLLTNGQMFEDDSKLPLLLLYDLVYVTDYTKQFQSLYGGETTTSVADKIGAFLAKQGRVRYCRETMDFHRPVWAPPYLGHPINCCHYYGQTGRPNDSEFRDMGAVYRGEVYGCCMAWQFEKRGKPIPLTAEWREHQTEIELPCEDCFLTGKGLRVPGRPWRDSPEKL